MKDDADPRGPVLLALARRALEESFGMRARVDGEIASWLLEPAATFVTLKIGGRLRGCIGSLTAYRPLLEDVSENARSAAFRDPRFPPLEAGELSGLEIEVSLLSAPQPIDVESEDDLIARLRPGVDGVVLESGFHRGTFLPQVWEQLPNPRDFLSALKRKAGLAADFWDDDVRVSRYTVRKWREGTRG
jgi:AmmeMemoRadiSam system protein A